MDTTGDGNIHTYRGDVIILIPSASLAIRAEEAVFQDDNKEIRLSGNVRLTLDVK